MSDWQAVQSRRYTRLGSASSGRRSVGKGRTTSPFPHARARSSPSRTNAPQVGRSVVRRHRPRQSGDLPLHGWNSRLKAAVAVGPDVGCARRHPVKVETAQGLPPVLSPPETITATSSPSSRPATPRRCSPPSLLRSGLHGLGSARPLGVQIAKDLGLPTGRRASWWRPRSSPGAAALRHGRPGGPPFSQEGGHHRPGHRHRHPGLCLAGWHPFLFKRTARSQDLPRASPGRRSPPPLPLVSRWYPPEHQGTAMGIAGAGNWYRPGGALRPGLAAAFGWSTSSAWRSSPEHRPGGLRRSGQGRPGRAAAQVRGRIPQGCATGMPGGSCSSTP